MTEALRITPQVAREKVLSGAALLVCAYEDEEKFRRMHLEGALSLREFRSRASALSRDQAVIFY